MTEQVPDVIRYEDKQYLTNGPHLPDYFHNPAQTRYVLDSKMNIRSERPHGSQIEFATGLSTANFRGYVAHWLIEDGYLYFESVQGSVEFGHQIFGCSISGVVIADWFSGTLWLRERRPPFFERRDRASEDERTIALEIVSGRVMSRAVGERWRRILEPARPIAIDHYTPFPADGLRLTVSSFEGHKPAEPMIWECDCKGGSIGSDPGADWVIPSAYIPHEPLRILYEDGRFILDPGRFSVAHVRRRNYVNKPVALNTGEKLWVGKNEFDITVLGPEKV